MPKVMRIINRFNLGGPTFNVAYLSKFMAPEFETLLVGGMKDASEDSSEFIVDRLGLEPVIIPEMKREVDWKNDRVAFRKVKELMREFQPDVVHTHASKAGALGRLAAHQLNVPVILHTFHGHVFHSYFGPVKTAFYKGVERYLAKKCNRIIAISARQKEELSQQHRIAPAGKVEVIPLGFELDRFREDKAEKRREFREEYGIQDHELAVGIVGRLVPIKNHQLFLEALQAARNAGHAHVKGVIVGDGELRQELEAQAQTMGIALSTPEHPDPNAPLIFTSWRRDVDRVYAGLDVVALTSLNEGTPVSLIEAQAAGKPIVSTRVGGVENILLEGETGLLSEAQDTAAFTKNLLRLLEDTELREQFSARGWEHVKARFHYTRLVNDMSQLYHDLLREAGR